VWRWCCSRRFVSKGSAANSERAKGDASNPAEFEDVVDAKEGEFFAEDLVDVMEGGGTNDDEADEKDSAEKSEPMLRQSASGPDPGEQCEGDTKERNDGDENALEDATVFVPACRLCELLEHDSEEALQIQLLIDAQGDHEDREPEPERAGAPVDAPRPDEVDTAKHGGDEVSDNREPANERWVTDPRFPIVNVHGSILAVGRRVNMGRNPIVRDGHGVLTPC